MSASLDRVNVSVVSDFNPDPAKLKLARQLIQNDSTLQECFMGQPDGEYLVERLSDPLEEGASEVVGYLIAEHAQVGNRIVVLHPETGRAIAALSEDDFYQPEPVPRESGSMVIPPRQVKGEIAAHIASTFFENDREVKIRQDMLSRVPSYIPAPVAERMVRFTTRAGRKQVAMEIHDRLPFVLSQARGATADFLRFFTLDGTPPKGATKYPLGLDHLTITAEVRIPVQDGKSQNLHFDQFSSLSSTVASQWIRGVASLVLIEANRREPEETLIVSGHDLVIAHEGAIGHVRDPVFMVSNVPHKLNRYVVGLCPLAGTVSFSEFQTEYREVHDEWRLRASASVEVHVDWSRVKVYRVPEVELVGSVVTGS